MLRSVAVVAIVTALVAPACGGGSAPDPERSDDGRAPAADGRTVATDKSAYPVFPDADSGADPSVPAAQGGRGFTGEGWETNSDYDLVGDPRAVKGGVLRQAMMTDFPATLRFYGPNISEWNLSIHELAYESLLFLHPTTLAYIPGLATHWQISGDRQTFRFRINPNARWSDGMPVTADDVVASWRLATDKGIQDPARNLLYSNYEPPVAESKYIVSVRARNDNWQNFMYFAVGARIGGLFIYPAHVLKNVTGDAYVRDFNYRMAPGTGPYMIGEQDVEKGRLIRIRRRNDYWAAGHRRNVGTANFDEIQQNVVRDRNLEFEMFKRGDIDYYFVQRAAEWVQELDYPNIKRGLNQKRKIFNHNPSGIGGLAMNTRVEPYTDIRVRRALRHLFNRESMVERLMFNEYFLIDSLFPNSVYENPENEKVRYDPQRALQLLAEAGWTQRDANGRLTKSGRPLTIEIVYAQQASERYFTIYQEDLRKVGITANLRFTTWETLIKLLDDRAFGMVSIAYTGELFPTPDINWLSELADQKNNNNITGFKNARADEIMRQYQKTFDFGARARLLHELDGILSREHHWLFEWTAPYERVAYWNKFGAPQGYFTRIGSFRDIVSLWWIDPERNRRLEEARKDLSIQLSEGPSDDKYWLEFARLESKGTPETR
ncbi:MAG: extracellular solute-binding protein [Longimicrobiales bacterium]